MSVLVTGSNGFIGKNLVVRLNEMKIKVKTFNRENSIYDLKNLIRETEFIIHLAGVNRPENEKDFDDINVGLTQAICEEVKSLGKKNSYYFCFFHAS